MIQIIKMIDVNVDGCGTDIDAYIKVEGETELTNGVIERTKKAIEKYKEENPYDWDTDTIIELACEYLKTEDYKAEPTGYNYCIEF